MTASSIVTAIADSMKPPPSGDDAKLRYIDATNIALIALGIVPFQDSGTTADRALSGRNAVMESIVAIEQMRSMALANGYLLPEPPFSAIGSSNKRRKLFETITGPSVDGYAAATASLVEVHLAWKRGEIDLETPTGLTTQLSSFDISVAGTGGTTGDALADILGYVPDADAIKRKAAVDGLAGLDFSRRRPKMLFIADVSDRAQDGVVVCWLLMRDAAAYTLRRRDVFTGETVERRVPPRTPADVRSLKTVVDSISFYDDVTLDEVCCYLDLAASDDRLYAYSVVATNDLVSGDAMAPFRLPSSVLSWSTTQIERLRTEIRLDAERLGGTDDVESISPYPAISRIVYGDEQYDWVIAAVNIVASTRRGDPVSVTKSYSYLGSRASTTIDSIIQGTFMLPNSMNDVSAGVTSSISARGVRQTLMAVLDATGTTLFVTNTDDPAGFQTTEEALEAATGPLRSIISSIDVETATVDPTVLVSNLSTPSFIDSLHTSTPVRLSSLNVSIIGAVGGSLIDLTTPDGIGRFVRSIRIFYDLSSVRS